MKRIFERQLAFWTAGTTGARAGLFRIALGLLSLPTAFELLVNRERYFADDGALPWGIALRDERVRFSLIALAPHSHGLLLALGVAMLVAGVTLALGIAPRASALVACVCHASFAARNPYVMNGGDRLFAILLGLAVLVPLSQRWSVSSFWRARRGASPARAPSGWGLGLVQLQVAWMYGLTGFSKLAQESWRTGRMMGEVFASPVYAEWPVVIEWRPFLLAMSFGVLAFECLFPVAIWWRRTRLPWLAAGVALHVGIDLFMVIPLFSAATLVSYTAFLTDEEVERAVAKVLSRLRRRRADAPLAGPRDEGTTPARREGETT